MNLKMYANTSAMDNLVFFSTSPPLLASLLASQSSETIRQFYWLWVCMNEVPDFVQFSFFLYLFLFKSLFKGNLSHFTCQVQFLLPPLLLLPPSSSLLPPLILPPIQSSERVSVAPHLLYALRAKVQFMSQAGPGD